MGEAGLSADLARSAVPIHLLEAETASYAIMLAPRHC
jgi:hypothetical protein